MKTTKITLALLALGMAVPAMAATDGTPGTSSSGSFDMTLTVSPPTGPTVQVLGLDDVNFGTIQTSSSSTTSVADNGTAFCLKRSDAGNVAVFFSQSGVSAGSGFQLNGTGSPIPLTFILRNPDATGVPLSFILSGVIYVVPQSSASCSFSSVSTGEAHVLTIAAGSLPSYAAQGQQGVYSGTVTVTVALP